MLCSIPTQLYYVFIEILFVLIFFRFVIKICSSITGLEYVIETQLENVLEVIVVIQRFHETKYYESQNCYPLPFELFVTNNFCHDKSPYK